LKKKLLIAFSTALYKSLKYLPNTTLWITGHYWASLDITLIKPAAILLIDFKMKRLVESIAVTIRTQVYILLSVHHVMILGK
jgi:hypothetical protein